MESFLYFLSSSNRVKELAVHFDQAQFSRHILAFSTHSPPKGYSKGIIRAKMYIVRTKTLHKPSKIKVPKDGSFQWFLESLAMRLHQPSFFSILKFQMCSRTINPIRGCVTISILDVVYAEHCNGLKGMAAGAKARSEAKSIISSSMSVPFLPPVLLSLEIHSTEEKQFFIYLSKLTLFFVNQWTTYSKSLMQCKNVYN